MVLAYCWTTLEGVRPLVFGTKGISAKKLTLVDSSFWVETLQTNNLCRDFGSVFSTP